MQRRVAEFTPMRLLPAEHRHPFTVCQGLELAVPIMPPSTKSPETGYKFHLKPSTGSNIVAGVAGVCSVEQRCLALRLLRKY